MILFQFAGGLLDHQMVRGRLVVGQILRNCMEVIGARRRGAQAGWPELGIEVGKVGVGERGITGSDANNGLQPPADIIDATT